MIMHVRALALASLMLVGGVVAAQTEFGLANQTKDEVFAYWKIPLNSPQAGKDVLQALAKVSAERHQLAPGEERRQTLKPGEALVGGFIPWSQDLNFRSPVFCGYLFFSEAPSGKTLLLTPETWLKFNQGRIFSAALQDLAILVPQYDFSGQASDWDKVLPIVRFSDAFRPRLVGGDTDAPAFTPIESLQAVIFDQTLWMRVKLSRSPRVSGAFLWTFHEASGSVLKLEVPWQSERGVGYLFKGDQAGIPSAFWHRQGNTWVVWWPLNRLEASDQNQLPQASVAFSEILALNGKQGEYAFADYSLAELP